MISPLTGSENVTPVFQVAVDTIVNGYRNELNINVSGYFQGMHQVELYRCNETGYRFFAPPSLAGDTSLYEQLEKYDWYYARWKWENDYALQHFRNGDRILDIGCGDGFFLDGIRKRGFQCEGIELNHSAAEKARSKHHTVHESRIEEFSKQQRNSYDVVCAMQVLEHIYDVRDFAQHAMNVVKPGGKLIFAVPNNNPFLYRYDTNTLLNLPPHHMGWWDKKSLELASKYFHAESCHVAVEPLQDNERYTYFMKYAENNLPASVRKTYARIRSRISIMMNEKRDGRNLVAVYTKPATAA